MEESAAGHYVIGLIQGCADLIADDSARGKTSGSVRRSRNESVKDSETTVETREFPNLICASEKVTVIDVSKPRVPLVWVDCEKSCRRWTVGNFVSNSIFVVKDECHKNQQMLLPVLWSRRTIIEEKSDELEGHLTYLTQSEELWIEKSCEKSWRGAESKLIQPRIQATKTGPHGKKHRTFQEEESFDFRKTVRHLVSAELRRFSPDSVTVHPPDLCCWFSVYLKFQQRARNMCKPLINYVCGVILEHLKKKKLVFLDAPWPVWTLNLASVRKVQAVVKLGVMESRISLDKREVMGETVLRKPGFVLVPPSSPKWILQSYQRRRRWNR